MTRQPPTTALQFGRTNKVRLVADVANDILTNLVLANMPKPVVINADRNDDRKPTKEISQ